MREIEIPEDNDRAQIEGITISVVCKHCFARYEVFISMINNFPGPQAWEKVSWDVCVGCLPRVNLQNKPDPYRSTRVLARYPYLNHG